MTVELLAHHWGAAFLYMLRSRFPIGICHKPTCQKQSTHKSRQCETAVVATKGEPQESRVVIIRREFWVVIIWQKSTARFSLVSDHSLIQRDIAKERRGRYLLGISAGMDASQAAEDTGCYTSSISAKATMSAKLSQREKLHCKNPRILKD